jgi:hypothetical protein
MAEAKKDAAPAPSVEVVVAPFAYALAKNGEVVMLGKGDLVTDRFVEGKEGEANTLAHLRAIGFIGKN